MSSAKAMWFAALLAVIGGGAAQAFPAAKPAVLASPDLVPAAMCGWSCRDGGRYIPGPPQVCADEGLNYCGPSRQRYAPPREVIVVPGGGYRGDYDYGGGLRPGQRDGIDGRYQRGGVYPGQRDGIDGRFQQGARPGQRDGVDGRTQPCRQRLTDSRGQGYWGPGRNCDEGK